MIRIGALSNIPGEEGEKIENAVSSELDEIISTIEAIHGAEYAEFVVPVATSMINTKQMMSLLGHLCSNDKEVQFLDMMVMASSQQTMELVLGRAKAFVQFNSTHKLNTIPKFLDAWQSDCDAIIKKLEEYKEGKGS